MSKLPSILAGSKRLPRKQSKEFSLSLSPAGKSKHYYSPMLESPLRRRSLNISQAAAESAEALISPAARLSLLASTTPETKRYSRVLSSLFGSPAPKYAPIYRSTDTIALPRLCPEEPPEEDIDSFHLVFNQLTRDCFNAKEALARTRTDTERLKAELERVRTQAGARLASATETFHEGLAMLRKGLYGHLGAQKADCRLFDRQLSIVGKELTEAKGILDDNEKLRATVQSTYY